VLRLLVAVAVLAVSPAARASPDDLVARPLVQRPGGVVARLTVELALQSGQLARPLSIAPDVWLGVTERLTLGLVHSNASIDQVDDRASLCLRGDALTCDHVYRGSGVDALWRWRDGELAVAPRARLLLRDTAPWKPAATLGALVRWTRGRAAITSDPYLRIGFAHQDLGNRSAVFVPLRLAVQPATGWLLAVHTGWDTELATWRDGWHVPVALELVARASPHLDVGIAAGFPQLLGPQNNVKERAMAVTLEYRP